jgi:hypothetical protein
MVGSACKARGPSLRFLHFVRGVLWSTSMRCSSLVDWPVDPRLRGTMQASMRARNSRRRSAPQGTAGKGIGGSGTRAGALQNGFRSVLAVTPTSRSKLGLLGRFGAPQPRPSEAGGGLHVRRLAPRRRTARTGSEASFPLPAFRRAVSAIFYSLPRRRCYARHGVDRPASRHAGLHSRFHVPSVQHGSVAMPKPMIDIPLASLRCPPEALPRGPETADTVAAA